MTSAPSPYVVPDMGRVGGILNDPELAQFITKNVTIAPRAREAAEWLIEEYPAATDEAVIRTLLRVLPSVLQQRLNVFFSYKAKDKEVAVKIANYLEKWSVGKLQMQHMARFGVEEVGREWRKKIEETIPACDWFLLLLPTPGEEANERDWVLFEAGYYWRGQDQNLGGRLVCLHHPDNEVANALEAHQSVPAEVGKVKDFLTGLFHEPNWIPGMPPLNSELTGLEAKANRIVQLIHRPSLSKKSCCGPHMEVAFDDPSSVKGWEELASGHVIDCNEECKSLFGLQLARRSFGEWVESIEGARQDEGWIRELAEAVRAAGEGRKVPAIHGTLALADGRRVRPTLCAVRRRSSDQKVEGVVFLFSETALPDETSAMSEELAALAITFRLAVRLRYQVLESFVGRKLESQDVRAFNRAMNELTRDAARDSRFGDPRAIRNKVVSLFVGEDRMLVEQMYERADQLWHAQGEGELDRAIDNVDLDALAKLIKEVGDMNQRFLIIASKRFAELIAGSGSGFAQDQEPRRPRVRYG